jgi:hypothetical protein
MSPVTLAPPPPALRLSKARPTPPPPIYHEVGCGYRPGRSLGLSILFHQLALIAILFGGRFLFVSRPAVMINYPLAITPSDSVIYLPTFGGGSEGAGRAGGGSGQPGEVTSSLPARSRRGFAYRGPQPMVSDPPKATLGIQTILQPSLQNPPLLHHYLPLPNLVQPASPPAQQPLVVKAESLAIRPERTVEAPKITLPTSDSSAIASLAALPHAIPQKAPAPPAPEASDVPTGHQAQDGLLVLNAVPPPPDVKASIPQAEARSRFAISPAEVTVIAAPAAGVEGGTSGAAAGTGTRADMPKGDTISGIPGGSKGESHGSGAAGTGSGGRYGGGHGTGLNAVASGSGTGRGAGAGSGAGTGSGASTGSGAGAGSAPGSGGFPGITIQGGRYGNTGIGEMHASLAPHHQTSYTMTIVSTPTSGGGLTDYGVFHDEKVYTVYMDMKANDQDPAPSWTLQYAVLQPTASEAGADGGSKRIQGTPTPPYAMFKEIPELAPELARKCEHKLIVASAIMNPEGKLEQVSVKQSPENQLVGPLVEALSHWIFQPAEIDGRPIGLKILLGIRLASGR